MIPVYYNCGVILIVVAIIPVLKMNILGTWWHQYKENGLDILDKL